jgi:hypothetical protein
VFVPSTRSRASKYDASKAWNSSGVGGVMCDRSYSAGHKSEPRSHRSRAKKASRASSFHSAAAAIHPASASLSALEGGAEAVPAAAAAAAANFLLDCGGGARVELEVNTTASTSCARMTCEEKSSCSHRAANLPTLAGCPSSRSVAVQVAFEKANFETGFSLDMFKGFETTRFQGMGFNCVQLIQPPPQQHAAAPHRAVPECLARRGLLLPQPPLDVAARKLTV